MISWPYKLCSYVRWITCNCTLLDYEQSFCFLIVHRERSEKNRPTFARPVFWAKGEKKKGLQTKLQHLTFHGRVILRLCLQSLFFRLSPRQQLSCGQLSRGLSFSLHSRQTIRKQRDCSQSSTLPLPSPLLPHIQTHRGGEMPDRRLYSLLSLSTGNLRDGVI